VWFAARTRASRASTPRHRRLARLRTTQNRNNTIDFRGFGPRRQRFSKFARLQAASGSYQAHRWIASKVASAANFQALSGRPIELANALNRRGGARARGPIQWLRAAPNRADALKLLSLRIDKGVRSAVHRASVHPELQPTCSNSSAGQSSSVRLTQSSPARAGGFGRPAR